jgi:hypothetical protein
VDGQKWLIQERIEQLKFETYKKPAVDRVFGPGSAQRKETMSTVACCARKGGLGSREAALGTRQIEDKIRDLDGFAESVHRMSWHPFRFKVVDNIRRDIGVLKDPVEDIGLIEILLLDERFEEVKRKRVKSRLTGIMPGWIELHRIPLWAR